MTALLEVRNLRTELPSAAGSVIAVDGVSFDIAQGETLGIVGESGSGKSMTALSIMGLVAAPGRVTADRLSLEGTDLLTLPESRMRHVRGRDIAMIFQDPMTSLNPVLSVGFQLSEQLQFQLGLSRRKARAESIDLLGRVGIPNASGRLDDYPHQFSGGMRQRVMIAMAISCQPRLLIADEATTALDVTIQAQIVDLVMRLCSESGMAVMWISHDLGVVAGLCDRVNVMYAGRLAESGTADSIYAWSRHGYTRSLMRSVPRIDQRRRRLETIAGQPPSLVDLPPTCPFQPRCAFALDRCRSEPPPRRNFGGDHDAACWADLPMETEMDPGADGP